MTMFSVRVADEIAQAFDRAAALRGGRSALLRQMILASATPEGAAREPEVRRDGARIMVRLAPADAAGVDAEAEKMGLRRAAWVAALVRRRVRGAPTLSCADAVSVQAIQVELRRIGVNLNQIASALNTAVLEGSVLELELGALDEMWTEIRADLRGLREALVGNLAYWEVGP